MVNAEKHKTAPDNDDGVKPIKSTIAIDFDDDKAFALCSVHSYEIKKYIADNFKKEITDLDVLNLSLALCEKIVTAKMWNEEKELINVLTDIINDDSKLNEFIFTELAKIRAWTETVTAIESKYGKGKSKDVPKKEFDSIYNANNEKYQYKAWNDERKIIDMYSGKFKAAKGDLDGGNN